MTTKKTPPTQLYRSETNRVVGGVAGGIGEYASIDPTIIRFVFVLLTIFGGSGILLYLVMWIVVPTASAVNTLSDHSKENVEEIKGKAKNFSSLMRAPEGGSNRSWWALLLIFLGIIFIFDNFGFYHVDLEKLWPIFLILLGVLILKRR